MNSSGIDMCETSAGSVLATQMCRKNIETTELHIGRIKYSLNWTGTGKVDVYLNWMGIKTNKRCC